MADAKPLPVCVASIWVGQSIGLKPSGEVDAESVEPIMWTLTLTPGTGYPTAFGARRRPGGLPRVIHGKWEHVTRTFKATEMPAFDETGGGERKLVGSLRWEEGELWLRGTWVEQGPAGERRGQFHVHKEDDQSDVHVSGLWLGKAIPDDSLAPFLIPVNPIKWAVSVVRGSADDPPFIFGSGYFEDVADVPGKPLLFYVLSGSWDPDTKALSVNKIYESKKETEGYAVDYVGTLGHDEKDSSWWLRGTWRNDKGGSFGNFFARRQPPSTSTTTSIFLCDICEQPIKPGETRWTCSQCLVPWTCCAGCQPGDVAAAHPHTLVPEAVYDIVTAEGTSCAAIAKNALQKFRARPFLGRREAGEERFAWLKYGDIEESALDLLAAMRTAGVETGALVAFCADLNANYVVAMVTALLAGHVVLPIHGALDDVALAHIFSRTKPAVCFVATEYMPKVRAGLTAGGADPRLIIEITCKDPPALVIPPPALAPPHVMLGDLLSNGRAARGSAGLDTVEVPPATLKTVRAVLFTSGSTGVPKGAVFNEELCLPSEGVTTVQPFLRLDFQAFDPSFVLSVLQTMALGGQRVFATNLTTLMSDFRDSRPTHVGATPVLWNSLFHDYNGRIANLLRAEENRPQARRRPREEIEGDLGNQMRRELGNRLSVATSGGAPISQQVLEFARTRLKLDIVDLYGSRETGGISRDGVVYPGVDVKLLSLPELGYLADGDPPQGEICVHSPRLIPGYWNDEEQTSKAFVTIDGKVYYRTGDVGEYYPRDRRIKVIDRAGAFFKLAQGEWVAPARIETVIEQCPWVDQALVLGSPAKPFVVAVVVPSKKCCAEFLAAPDNAEVRARTTAQVLREVRFWCVHHHLRPIEVPQAVHLETAHWTIENEFLTPTEKKRRGPLEKHYRAIRDALYGDGDAAAAAVIDDAAEALPEEFVALLGQVLPSRAAFAPEATFAEIGGDSLSAARFANIMREHRVQISPQVLFEYPLSHVARLFAAQRAGAAVQPVAARPATNWALEWALPADLPPLAKSDGSVRGVFVTGATGFLGPVMLGEILKRFAGAPVVCLVRGKDSSHAFERLRADMTRAGTWTPDVEARIRVVAGDLNRPHFGLAPDVWDAVVRDTSDIFHSGAWVNMAVPYAGLKAANVGGTVTVLRLALQAGARLHYVSTVGALPGGDPSECAEEWLKLDFPQIDKKDGYGQTKVVCERLLLEAKLKYGLDVRVFRPSAISGHTLTGYSNTLDYSSILLRACVAVGSAVRNTTASFHWIPVDFVAAAIAVLARQPASAGQVYNLTGDGPALKQVLSVMEARGLAVRDVPAEAWRRDVEALPETERIVFPLKHQLAAFEFNAAPAPPLPTEHARTTLAALGLPWPAVDAPTIARSIDWLKTDGFFDTARVSA